MNGRQAEQTLHIYTERRAGGKMGRGGAWGAVDRVGKKLASKVR